MAGERSTGLWLAIVTGLLTVLAAVAGNLVNGYTDLQLERTKFDSRLILNALDSSDVEQRRESLRFLVNANLIRDGATVHGLRRYFEGDRPESPPQLRPFVASGESRVLTPASPEVAANTDVDLFVCGKDKADAGMESAITRLHGALRETGRFGASNLKVWDRGLYDEIPLAELVGATTVVVDREHGEAGDVAALRGVLETVAGLPPPRVVANRGEPTPWRISIIACR